MITQPQNTYIDITICWVKSKSHYTRNYFKHWLDSVRLCVRELSRTASLGEYFQLFVVKFMSHTSNYREESQQMRAHHKNTTYNGTNKMLTKIQQTDTKLSIQWICKSQEQWHKYPNDRKGKGIFKTKKIRAAFSPFY